MNIDDVLQKVGLKYDDLKVAEKETLERWLGAINQKTITVNGIKEYLEEMRDKVEIDLVVEPEFRRVFFGLIKVPNRKCILLKARLENYLLLLSFMATPEKAKAAMERALAGMVMRSKK
jgi:hypothetical protein